jgi:FkbM family methyltransferase
VILTDWAGYDYWQNRGDSIRCNWKRNSATDSTGVVQYILKHAKPGWTCVDIGAHIGAVSVPLWSKAVPAGRVISVEADPRNVERIKANLSLNGYSQDYVVNAALTDTKGTAQLRCYEGINGWQTLGNPSFAASHRSFLIEVPAMSFSDLVEMFDLESIDLVKIDVEGAEPLVVNGMVGFLQEKRIGRVIFEVNYLMLEGLGKTVSELLSPWDDFGYELWQLAEDGSLAAIRDQWPSNLIGDCVASPCKENV